MKHYALLISFLVFGTTIYLAQQTHQETAYVFFDTINKENCQDDVAIYSAVVDTVDQEMRYSTSK
jgi:hypothetical protein